MAQSIVGTRLEEEIEVLARSDSSVLLTGESGTGKTTIARQIHSRSKRSHMPFVAVSCAAIPKELLEAELFGYERGAFTGAVASRPGKAELADGGTLFLDEIGDLPLDIQPKLLTFLQDRTIARIGRDSERKIDVRVIAATLHDLSKMVRENTFRKDLFFRLDVLSIQVPALRERKEDIPATAQSILRKFSEASNGCHYRLSAQAMAVLMQHDWPGNIRELENVLQRAIAFSSDTLIDQRDLQFTSIRPAKVAEPIAPPALSTLKELERFAIEKSLESCEWNKARAARQLNISEKSIYNKIKKYNLFPHSQFTTPKS